MKKIFKGSVQLVHNSHSYRADYSSVRVGYISFVLLRHKMCWIQESGLVAIFHNISMLVVKPDVLNESRSSKDLTET